MAILAEQCAQPLWQVSVGGLAVYKDWLMMPTKAPFRIIAAIPSTTGNDGFWPRAAFVSHS